MNIQFLLLVTLLLTVSLARSEEWVNRQLMGTNLDNPRDWGTILPFTDLMKQARVWSYQKGDTDKPELDEMGNWKPVAGKKPATWIAISNRSMPAGVYVLTWEGKGKVGVVGHIKDGKVVKEEANCLKLDLPAGSSLQIEIAESDPADPVRNVHCWLPGFEDGKTLFNPAFKQYLPVFGTLRFMEWIHVNDSKQSTWAKRPVAEQQFFRLEDRNGVPLEWMIALANETKTNPWFCMPHLADDDYVRNFAKMVKEKLDPSLKIYIEYSNEIWNTGPGFNQTQYAAGQGLAMGIDKGKAPDAAWYSKRSLEIWKIWEEVFGGRDRHVRVLAGFAVAPRNMEFKLEYLGDPKLADAIAIAPYAGFSRDIRTGDFDPTGKTSQDLLDIVNGQLGEVVSHSIVSHAAIAKKTGLLLIAYEFGMATGTPAKYQGDKAVSALFQNITEIPGMEQTMERYSRLWFEKGGQLACYFAYVANPSPYGSWGNMGQYLGQPDSEAPRRRAIKTVAADPNLVTKEN
jgi:hypothetical protein